VEELGHLEADLAVNVDLHHTRLVSRARGCGRCITFVLADGTVAKAGGKVIKNVAGYDLAKLVTGSFGTLGLVVEVAR